VGTQGALGEVYLEVLPGLAKDALPENAVIRGLDPPRLDVVLSRMYSLLESAVNDQAFRSFLVEVSKLAGTIDGVLTDNKEALGGFFRDTAAMLGNGSEALEDVRVAAKSAAALLSSPELKGTVADLAQAAKAAREQLPPLLDELHGLASRLDKTTAAMGPDDVAKVKATLAKFDALSAQMQKVATSADAILARVDKGEGTIGALAKDPKVYEDLKAMLADLKAHPWKFLWKD
jgi:phospholipid/cholesterol/gamma-HCH transport system substrate-binding protein